MSGSSSLLRITKRLRRIRNALPPFPTLPSFAQIARWWRYYGPSLPSLPSPREIAFWWRRQRHYRVLPPLPHVPSPTAIVKEVSRYRFLPRLPSPRKMIAWLRARPRRRKIAGRWAVAAIILTSGAIAAPHAFRAIQGWQARRLADQSLLLIDQQNWEEAAKKLQGASRIRNSEPAIWHAYARLLSRTGQGEFAVEWWRKIAREHELSLDDHRDYAAAAISARELTVASRQIDLLFTQKEEPTVGDLTLAGELATFRGYNATALTHAEKILQDPRADSREILSGIVLIFLNTTPESPSYSLARERLLKIARDETDPASTQALALLAGRQDPARPVVAVSIDISGTAIPPNEIADLLEKNPNSRPFHKMLALELRARAEPNREDELVAQAVHKFGGGDDETLIALGDWLSSRSRFDSLLQIVPLERAARRRELFVQRVKALAALGRFEELKEMLLQEQPVLAQALQHMYLAVVRSNLGESTASMNEWGRALEKAETAQELVGLADYAEKHSALDIAEAAYAQLIAKQPDLRSAYTSRLRLAEARGATTQAHAFAAEIVQIWPEDPVARMHEVYLRLLLGASAAEAKEAEQESDILAQHNPWSLGARMTLALARLKQNKRAEALAAVSGSESEKSSETIPLVVRAAALAANGWNDRARAEAHKLTTVSLLPEERALIAPILKTPDNPP